MNEKHKKKKKSLPMKTGTYVILIIVVVVFIGGPLVTLFLQDSIAYTEFGSYAGKAIHYDSSNYFGRSAQVEISTMRERLGNVPIDPSLQELAIENAFNHTVEVYALLELAKKNNYIISDVKINKKISEHPELKDENDKFDIELYQSIPKDERLKNLEIQRQFELSATIRNDLIETEYISSLEQEFLNLHNANRRSLNYIAIDHRDIKNKDILRSFADENFDLFIKYSFQSLTVSDIIEAQTIKTRLENDDSDFVEEIQSYSIDDGKENEGDRGSQYAFQIENDEGKEALEAIQALSDTESYSEIIRTNSGDFAFYRLSEDMQIPDFKSDEELEIVQEYINEYDSSYAVEKIEEQAEEFIALAKQDGFLKTAADFDLEVFDSNSFPLNIGSESVFDTIVNDSENSKPVQFIYDEEELLTELFSLDEGEISNFFTYNNDSYVFFLQSISKPDEETVTTEQDTNRISAFLRNLNQEGLNKNIVQEEKLDNKFTEAYSKAFVSSQN